MKLRWTSENGLILAEASDGGDIPVGCGLGTRQIIGHASRLTFHAFTLLEILIVMAIMAVVLAIGLPAFVRGMKKEGLRKAVSDVVEGCSHTRAQAILKGVPMEFVIRAEDGSLSVQRAKPATGDEFASGTTSPEGQPVTEVSSGGSSFAGNLPEDVGVKLLYVNFQDKMEFPEARVRFFPNGTSDEFTIILFAESGEKKINLDVVTALADMEVIR